MRGFFVSVGEFSGECKDGGASFVVVEVREDVAEGVFKAFFSGYCVFHVIAREFAVWFFDVHGDSPNFRREVFPSCVFCAYFVECVFAHVFGGSLAAGSLAARGSGNSF